MGYNMEVRSLYIELLLRVIGWERYATCGGAPWFVARRHVGSGGVGIGGLGAQYGVRRRLELQSGTNLGTEA